MLKFLRDERGASAAEYALMLAVIGAGVACASLGLTESMANAINRAQAQFALVGGGPAAGPAESSAASGAETPAAADDAASGEGQGQGAAYGHGKSNNGQGHAYGKTRP